MSYQTKKWVRLYDVAEQYAVRGKVGRGTFGTVYKAVSQKDNKNYALKKLENTDPKMISEGFPITALRQIALLKEIDHPNIIKLKEILLSKPSQRNMNRGSTFLVFEYMDHDLAGIIKNKIRFTLAEIKCLAKQLLEGVAYIHSQKLLHRDIKSANILLNRKGELKLGDFGLGRKFKNDGNLTYKVVTLWYRAPELILGYKKYDYKVDVWSVGCVLAQLLIGDILFKKQSDFAQLQKILEVTGDYQTNNMTEEMMKDYTTKQEMLPLKRFPRKFEQSLLALNPQVPKDAIQFLSHLLELNPEKRYTCEEALNHPFFESEPKPVDKQQIKKFEYEMKEFFKQNSVKIDYETDKREDQAKKYQKHEKGDDYRHERNDSDRYYRERKRHNDSRKRSFSKQRSKNEKKRQTNYNKEKRKRSYDSNLSSSSNYSRSPVRERRTRQKNHRRQDKNSSQESRSHRKQHRNKDHDRRRQQRQSESHRQYSNRYDREDRRYEREKYERNEQVYKKTNRYEGQGSRNKSNYKDRDYDRTYRDRKEEKGTEKYRDQQRYRNTQRNQKRQYNPDEGREKKYEKPERYERTEKYNKYERYDRGQKGSERYDYKYKSDKQKEYSGRYDENRYKKRPGDHYDHYRGPNKYDRQRKADDQHYHDRSNDNYSRKNYGDRYQQRSRQKPRERNRGQNNEKQNPRYAGAHKQENYDY